MSKEVVETKARPSAAAEKPATKEPNAFGFADDLANCTLHWNEDMRELTIKSDHKIGLPFGDKIRALVAAAPEMFEACKFIDEVSCPKLFTSWPTRRAITRSDPIWTRSRAWAGS